jgi:hypothetical protein
MVREHPLVGRAAMSCEVDRQVGPWGEVAA